MALLFSESFGAVAALTDFISYGSSIPGANAGSTDTIDTTGGYNSQPAYKCVVGSPGSLSSYISYPTMTAPTSNEIRFGFWLKLTSGATNGNSSNATTQGIFALFDSALSKYVSLRLSATTGKLGFLNMSTGANLTNPVYTGTITVADGQSHFVEGRIILSDALAGTFQTWIDGVADINQTGISNGGGFGLTAAALVKVQVGTWCGTVNNTQWLSHIMVWDTSGTAMNGYLGPARVEYLAPNAAGTNSALTPTSGANYTTVNEQVANFDTSYVEGATSGLIDTYNYTNLATSPSVIAAVAVKSFAKNADVGSKTFRTKCLSNVTYSNGADVALTVSYKSFFDVYTVDPNTAVAWTAAGLNAAEFGIEVRT